MRAPTSSFADAVDVFRHRYPVYECQFLVRMRQSHSVPPARTASDYMDLIGSLYVAWSVAWYWPRRPEETQWVRQEAIRRRDVIRSLIKEDWLAPWFRDYLGQEERLYMAWAKYNDEIFLFVPISGEGLPKRRDHLTVADLGRERRGAGQMLFVREVSFAMRNIFGKPHDKIVGILTGLAFETGALSPETVRAMRKETGVTRPE